MTALTQTEFSRLVNQTGLPLENLEKTLGYSRRTLARYESGDSTPKPPVLETLRNIIKNQTVTSIEKPAFRFIDLFAGIGGLRRGFDGIGGECLFTSEWNQYAQKTYLANYHDKDTHIMAGDITKIDAVDIPAHDMLLAGFPCQPFSIAGVSKKNSLGRAHGFSGESLFLRKLVLGIPAQASGKNLTRLLCLRRPDSSSSPRPDPTGGRNIGSK